MLAGGLQHRIHTRQMDKMGGLWGVVPKMGFMALFFTVAAVGMPGLGNFIGEFLVLLGTFRISPAAASLAAIGMVVAAVYSLIVIQKVFHGENTKQSGCGRFDHSRDDLLWLDDDRSVMDGHVSPVHAQYVRADAEKFGCFVFPVTKTN